MFTFSCPENNIYIQTKLNRFLRALHLIIIVNYSNQMNILDILKRPITITTLLINICYNHRYLNDGVYNIVNPLLCQNCQSCTSK